MDQMSPFVTSSWKADRSGIVFPSSSSLPSSTSTSTSPARRARQYQSDSTKRRSLGSRVFGPRRGDLTKEHHHGTTVSITPKTEPQLEAQPRLSPQGAHRFIPYVPVDLGHLSGSPGFGVGGSNPCPSHYSLEARPGVTSTGPLLAQKYAPITHLPVLVDSWRPSGHLFPGVPSTILHESHKSLELESTTELYQYQDGNLFDVSVAPSPLDYWQPSPHLALGASTPTCLGVDADFDLSSSPFLVPDLHYKVPTPEASFNIDDWLTFTDDPEDTSLALIEKEEEVKPSPLVLSPIYSKRRLLSSFGSTLEVEVMDVDEDGMVMVWPAQPRSPARSRGSMTAMCMVTSKDKPQSEAPQFQASDPSAQDTASVRWEVDPGLLEDAMYLVYGQSTKHSSISSQVEDEAGQQLPTTTPSLSPDDRDSHGGSNIESDLEVGPHPEDSADQQIDSGAVPRTREPTPRSHFVRLPSEPLGRLTSSSRSLPCLRSAKPSSARQPRCPSPPDLEETEVEEREDKACSVDNDPEASSDYSPPLAKKSRRPRMTKRLHNPTQAVPHIWELPYFERHVKSMPEDIARKLALVNGLHAELVRKTLRHDVKMFIIFGCGLYEQYFSWNQAGDMITIHDIHVFCENVMSRFYNSRSVALFQRQSRTYGFTARSIEGGKGFTVEHPHLLRKGREEIWRLVSLIPPEVSTMIHPVHIDTPASARSAAIQRQSSIRARAPKIQKTTGKPGAVPKHPVRRRRSSRW